MAARVLLLRAILRRGALANQARTHKRGGPLPATSFPADLKANTTGVAKECQTKGHIEPYLVGATKLSSVPKEAIPIGANTTWRFLQVGAQTTELYPLFACFIAWAVGTTFIIYWNFSKNDIWLDRSKKLPPWDWERERDAYYKHNNLLWKPYGEHKRIAVLETLQDEMLDAARQRGTR